MNGKEESQMGGTITVYW